LPQSQHTSQHTCRKREREQRERASERASETERFLIATKPACISAQADIVLARALASLTGITHQCTRVHAHTRMYMFNKHAVFIVYYGAERN
jgi:16S rRNA G527 N7-methylase RsmG